MKILITGCRQGIGRDTAIALSKRGHHVVATTRTEQGAKSLRKFAIDQEVDLHVVKLDILLKADRQMAKSLHVDILINNAGIGKSGPLIEVPVNMVRDNFETNVFATLELTQAIGRQMIQRNSGRIITVSSIAGRITIPFLGPYSMTKYALESMHDALRIELSSFGIFVSLIEPGAIATGFNERMNDSKYSWLKTDSLFNGKRDDMKKYEALLTKSPANSSSVVAAIIHAVEAKRPKPRYVRPRSFFVHLFTMLPTYVKDILVRQSIR